jgi:AcrR family transcriptional regulator
VDADDAPSPRRGRPADPNLDDALRAAAHQVLTEYGWRGTTIERIAERAGVARTTVYRRHGSVHGVLLLMMGDLYSTAPVVDTGSLRGDLVMIMRSVARTWRDPAHVDYVCALLAAQRENAELGEAYRAQMKVRREDTTQIVRRAAARGEIRTGLDPGLLLDLLSGVIWQRVLLDGAELGDDFADEVVDAVLIGFATV